MAKKNKENEKNIRFFPAKKNDANKKRFIYNYWCMRL